MFSNMATRKATAQKSAAPVATATAPARAAKPATPRVRKVTHAKPAAVAAEAPAVEVAMAEANAHEEIQKIAYGYWTARNFAPGDPMIDWLQAEAEFYSRQ
jgi:hypothetical protein